MIPTAKIVEASLQQYARIQGLNKKVWSNLKINK